MAAFSVPPRKNQSSAWICLVLLIAVTLGCGTTSTPVIPTSAPLPTSTPEPSATPLPTSTPTPLPTDTPTITPTFTSTPDLTATASAALQDVMTKELKGIDLTLGKGSIGGQWKDPIQITVTKYMEEHKEPLGNDPVGDFVLYTDITWNSSSGLAGCGIVFRSEDDLDKGASLRFYLMRLSGMPLWDVEYWKYGVYQSAPGRAQPHGGIDDSPGGTNSIVLVAKGTIFTVYANRERLGIVEFTKLPKGKLAFMAWQESGETSCKFRNTWLWISQ